MDDPVDKQWASKYVLDPLTAPEPSQETGPGSHFVTKGHNKSASSSSASALPTPPNSTSPSRTSFPATNPYSPSHRQEAFGDYPNEGPSKRNSTDKRKSTEGSNGENKNPGRLRRGSSLSERFPGDMSHRPLDQLRREAKMADRSPHLKKKHIPGADLIDSLDNIGGAYHHGGPYDATLLARNTSFQNSPVEAVRESNAMALKATPQEYVQDSIQKHVPLQGTSVVPPGERDLGGRKMQYEEGADMMREPGMIGGEYKRWSGMKYHPDDLKGKGEPSYSIEKALRDHKTNGHSHRRVMSDGNEGYEMQSRPATVSRQRSASGTGAELAGAADRPSSGVGYAQFEGDMRRSHTTGRKVGETLKRRFGSLRRSKKATDA